MDNGGSKPCASTRTSTQWSPRIAKEMAEYFLGKTDKGQAK